ncbi:MAG TPA: type ISP restriction/modification enzyme [Terracidiphilus sp.]|nr:type ISP restriction/modification enzyme [Terracidiphilus sp.]
MDDIFKAYSDEVAALSVSQTTTEPSYYPAIKSLFSKMLSAETLPFEVRASTSESRAGGGHDMPDLALYDGDGDYLVVAGEVKLPSDEIKNIAFSEDRNDQIGRYLAKTSVVLVSNVRGFGLLTVRHDTSRDGNRVAPANRVLEHVVELWPSTTAMEQRRPIPREAIEELYLLLETAVTRYAPIAEPESLAKILARQAKRAKAQLPTEFTQAVRGLADDFGKALGVSFEGEEGEEFFRSSLIQTVFYGLFAGWTLWLRSESKPPFRWEDLAEHLKIPFLAELYYEFQHPRRIQELGLRPHLDLATETLHRVDTAAFFRHFELPSVRHREESEGHGEATAAIIYFYEPFLEAFDPELRKSLGVWYTPREVVQYQVRTIDKLLREQLGCDRGFADENVIVLDPCCGTGAYLIEVMRSIAEQLESEGAEALMGQTLLDAATKRLVGFELLTAPFVIAQLQMFLILSELGAKPTATHRPAVFLTNALTGWDGPEQMKLHFPELQAEYDAAHAVKRAGKIIVVIGNPPYNRFAGVPLSEEADLVDRYKGIRRDDKGKQVGPSELYTRWGIRKQLLDDLYVRFFRLAERCIGERAEYGIVSFISNYSFYTGRSHPIMRSSLLQSFDEIWIDSLNGDKYKTGKVIPNGLPGEGTTDQSIFTTEHDPRGIQVGAGITTLLKRRGRKRENHVPTVHYRNYWGRSQGKREALLSSLSMNTWSSEKMAAATRSPEGPRSFESFVPTEQSRWKLVPFAAQGGFDDWPALDQLFVTKLQGVNPNRGLDGSVVAMDRESLADRMRDYFSNMPLDRLLERYPVLMQDRARYAAATVRGKLKKQVGFDENKIVPYVTFPLDQRWIYYETEFKFLNEARAELYSSLSDNEFLVTVPEPRKESETRPILLTTAFDLHLHDRGSVSFPVTTISANSLEGTLFAAHHEAPKRHANLATGPWEAFRNAYDFKGDLFGKDAQKLARCLARVALALCHSPQYQSEHKESLAQDWAHIPIPKSFELLQELVDAGDKLAVLLNPVANSGKVLKAVLADELKQIAVPTKIGGGNVGALDLLVEYSFFGGAQGGWRGRPASGDEPMHGEWGAMTGDLYINDAVFYRHVPERAWRYDLGGYPVIKKWLGYRDRGRRPGVPLSVQETSHLRGMVQRLCAVLSLHARLDSLYESACRDCFSAEELGL